MRTLLSMLTVALLLAASCGGSSSPSSPTPAAVAPQWNVTQSFVSVVGPDNCWITRQRATWTGAVFPNLPMTVTRSGSSITLASASFQVNYTGTINSDGFSATGGPLSGGGGDCGDGKGVQFPQLPGVSNLTGGFSADDQQMTATEVNSYRLVSGETVTYTWGWQATRR